QQAVQNFTDQPTQANAIALRHATVDWLDASAAATDRVVASTRRAGIPDVKRGDEFAKAVVAHARDVAKALRTLARQAARIDVSTGARFANEFQDISGKIDAAQQRLLKSAARDHAFTRAPASLHPLVVYMTTDATTCPAAGTA